MRQARPVRARSSPMARRRPRHPRLPCLRRATSRPTPRSPPATAGTSPWCGPPTMRQPPPIRWPLRWPAEYCATVVPPPMPSWPPRRCWGWSNRNPPGSAAADIWCTSTPARAQCRPTTAVRWPQRPPPRTTFAGSATSTAARPGPTPEPRDGRSEYRASCECWRWCTTSTGAHPGATSSAPR